MPRKRTKILHIVFSLEPGGMENGLVNVASALDPDEFEVHVCCLEQTGAFAERFPNSANIHVLSKRHGFSIKTVFALNRLISWLKPDVLHSHNLGPLIYASLATGFGIWKPILHGEHGFQPGQFSPQRIRKHKFFFRACRRVHTVSETLTRDLRKLGFPLSRLVTIVNGVDTERFFPADKIVARKRINLPADALVIGIVGRFAAHKRVTDLIAAFSVLADKFPATVLLIVGGGVERPEILDCANASSARMRIQVTDFQRDTVPFYQAMDLLVTLSLHEGMSNVVLEAMSCGVPALAHDVCGNSEVITVGKDGIVADLGSIAILQAELEKILSKPVGLTAMGVAAREKVTGKFSLQRMAADYAALYRELSKATLN